MSVSYTHLDVYKRQALVFAALWVEMRQASRDLVQGAIDTDLAGLVDAYGSHGPQGLADRNGERLAFSPDPAQGNGGEVLFYRLEDAGGRVLAGNLAAWPQARAEVSEAGEMRIAGGVPVQYRVTPVSYTHLDVYKRQGYAALSRHDAEPWRGAGV